MKYTMSSRSAVEGRHGHSWPGGIIILVYTIILYTTLANNFIIICNVHAIKSPRSFIGSRRKPGTTNNRHDKEEGFTLGELDQMMQSNKDTSILLDSNILLASDTSNQPPQAQAEESTNNNTNHQLRRRLGKINLDLSGRIMCHLLSPQDDDTSTTNQVYNIEESIPLFTIPTQSKHKKIQRFMIPNVFIGVNYDLDEIWYGATRYIARCSWKLPSLSKSAVNGSLDSTNIGSSTSTPHNRVVLESMNNMYKKLFPASAEPSSMMKNWMIDVEGEQCVFDKSDTTSRICLIQSPSSSSPTIGTTRNSRRQQGSQQVSIEYDSAKYTDDNNSQTSLPNRSQLQYAPTISLNIQTPFITNRLHLNTKRTWIVSNSGDKHDNYYKGNYYSDLNSSVKRRLDSIKEGYRRCIPQSQSTPSTTGVDTSSSSHQRKENLFNKLSKWLENDGWVPNKVTTDLMGNLHSINEVGFGNNESFKDDDKDIKKQRQCSSSSSSSSKSIIPPIHNTGIKLHISKKIDWTTLPIFPWSNRNDNSNHNHSGGIGMMDALQSTQIQIEICGIDTSGMKVTSIGLNADLLDWKDTFRITFGQESVADVSV